MKMFAVKVTGVQFVVVDAEDESEAMKLAIEEANGNYWDADEAEIEQDNLNDRDIKSYLLNGANDLRTDGAKGK